MAESGPPRKTSGLRTSGLRTSDLRGAARLAVQATEGVTRIVEGVHQSVWRTLGAPDGSQPGRTRGVTGLVYRGIEGVTRLAGKGLDAAIGEIAPLLESPGEPAPESAKRVGIIAALNGVMGDRLARDANALAMPMSLRWRGNALDTRWPAADEVRAKVVLFVHGLCMSDLAWQPPQGGGLGEVLSDAMGSTPLYLRYNTGLHVWQNARLLDAQLQRLATRWPRPVESLTIVAHSMGGLVTRSAVHTAQSTGSNWTTHLRHIAFLGTPHHGAPLEQAGHWVEAALGATPWTLPFTRLTSLRAAGITDLREGRVVESGQQVPLPAGVECFAMAATTAASRGPLADRLVGDGLVPLRSALGMGDRHRKALCFEAPSQWIGYRMNHMQLLDSPEVFAQLQSWLAAR